MRRTQGSPQTIKFSSGGCVVFSFALHPCLPPPPLPSHYSVAIYSEGCDEALALQSEGTCGDDGAGAPAKIERMLSADPDPSFLFVCEARAPASDSCAPLSAGPGECRGLPPGSPPASSRLPAVVAGSVFSSHWAKRVHWVSGDPVCVLGPAISMLLNLGQVTQLL